MGPLFFFIHLNDFALAFSCYLSICLYADDTTIYHHGSDLDSLLSSFSAKLQHLLDWIKYNRMSINWSKTKVMFITKKHVEIPKTLNIDGNAVDVVNKFKLLGVVIDKDLSFKDHVDSLKIAVNRKLFSYKKLFFLSFHTKVQFFKTFILPHFDYCLSLYIYFDKTLLDSIENFFNICLFRLLNLELKHLTLEEQSKVLKPLNLLPFKLRFFYRISIFVYKILNGNILNNFNKLKFHYDFNNLRNVEIADVPFESTKCGSHRLDIFLPRFVNAVIKLAFQLSFRDYKRFLINNIFILFNNFVTNNFFNDQFHEQ